jgi:hypothetical protein
MFLVTFHEVCLNKILKYSMLTGYKSLVNNFTRRFTSDPMFIMLASHRSKTGVEVFNQYNEKHERPKYRALRELNVVLSI